MKMNEVGKRINCTEVNQLGQTFKPENQQEYRAIHSRGFIHWMSLDMELSFQAEGY